MLAYWLLLAWTPFKKQKQNKNKQKLRMDALQQASKHREMYASLLCYVLLITIGVPPPHPSSLKKKQKKQKQKKLWMDALQQASKRTQWNAI